VIGTKLRLDALSALLRFSRNAVLWRVRQA